MPIPSQSESIADTLLGGGVQDVKPAPMFLLVHHFGRAGSWEVDEIDGAPVWLPVLAQIPLVPGANGVRTVERGEDPSASVDLLLAALRKSGAIVIPADRDVCGVRHTVGTRVKRGTRYHLWCETATANPMQGRKDVISCDTAAYNRWRRDLYLDGHIPAPPAGVLDMVRSAASSAVSRWRGNKSAHPETRALKLAAVQATEARVAAAKVPESEPATKSKGKGGAA